MNNDQYKMHGIVRIYDENHNLIQEKNNMIVEEGRKKILNVLFGKENKPTFNYFYETGNSTILTKPDSVYNSTNSTIVTESDVSPKPDSDTTISITYTATIKSNDNITNPILAVGLCWEEGQSTKLFSRAAIDPIYMNPNRKYQVEHTIYF